MFGLAMIGEDLDELSNWLTLLRTLSSSDDFSSTCGMVRSVRHFVGTIFTFKETVS